jgi:hypothetical protein
MTKVDAEKRIKTDELHSPFTHEGYLRAVAKLHRTQFWNIILAAFNTVEIGVLQGGNNGKKALVLPVCVFDVEDETKTCTYS